MIERNSFAPPITHPGIIPKDDAALRAENRAFGDPWSIVDVMSWALMAAFSNQPNYWDEVLGFIQRHPKRIKWD